MESLYRILVVFFALSGQSALAASKLDLRVPKVQLAASSVVLTDRFIEMKRTAPRSVEKGSDVSILCMTEVFGNWYDGFVPVIRVQPADYQDQAEVRDLHRTYDHSRSSIDAYFETMRPGLYDLIRSELNKLRSNGMWPPAPTAMAVDNVLEPQYITNLSACKNPAFITSINSKMPSFSPNGLITARVIRNVPVNNTGRDCLYCEPVSAHVESVSNETKTYEEWINTLREQ